MKKITREKKKLKNSGNRNTVKYADINNIIEKMAKEYITDYNTRLIHNITVEHKGPKHIKFKNKIEQKHHKP